MEVAYVEIGDGNRSTLPPVPPEHMLPSDNYVICPQKSLNIATGEPSVLK